MSTIVNSADEFNKLLKKYPKMAIDFKAVWCGPCKLISPAFEGHAKAQKEALKADNTEAKDDIIFVTIDVDEVPEIAQKYNITAMPTFKFLVNGKEVDELIGANKGSLETKVKSLIGIKTEAPKSDPETAPETAPKSAPETAPKSAPETAPKSAPETAPAPAPVPVPAPGFEDRKAAEAA